MKRRTIAEATGIAARPYIAARPRGGSDGRLVGGEAEMIALERWENEGGIVRDRSDPRAAVRLQSIGPSLGALALARFSQDSTHGRCGVKKGHGGPGRLLSRLPGEASQEGACPTIR
jgi:hypothetical protein